MQDEQTPQEALNIINQALGTVVANRDTHVAIQLAFQTLSKFVAEGTAEAVKGAEGKKKV